MIKYSVEKGLVNALCELKNYEDFEELIRLADEEMYKYKAEYYKNKENNRRKR